MKFAFWPRALLTFARPLTRIAKALEEIKDLYRLELQSQGIHALTPGLKDEVEVAYGPQEIRRGEEDEEDAEEPILNPLAGRYS